MAAKVEIDIYANDKTGGALGGIKSALGGVLQTAAGFVTGQLFMKAGQAIGDLFTSTMQAGMESQASLAQLEAVLKSTGGAAGLSSQSLQDYASELQNITAFDDEAIQGAESMLLTFTNIKGDVFKNATSAVLDMSQAMGQDLKSSSIQLGKALNDPIAGVGALSRVGVQFTDDQKKMIEEMVKSGDVMGAQKVILAELDKEFSGSAEAFANTYPGKLKQFENAMGNVKESLADGLMPIMTDFLTNVIMPMIPAIQSMADRFVEWMEGLQESAAFKTIMDFILSLKDAFINLFGIMNPDAFNALDLLLPVFDLFADGLDAIANFTLTGTPLESFLNTLQAWAITYGPDIMESFNAIWTSLVDGVMYIGQGIMDFFNNTMGLISIWLVDNGPLIDDFIVVLANVFTFLMDVLKVVWDFIQPLLEGIVGEIFNLVTIVMALITGDWAKAWEYAQKFVSDMIVKVAEALTALWDGILSLFGTSSEELGRQWNDFWEGVVDSVNDWADGIRNKISIFFNLGVDIIVGWINGMKSKATELWDYVLGIADKIKQTIADAFRMHSPSKVMFDMGGNIMKGLAQGIGDGLTFPIKAMANVAPAMTGALGMPALAGGMGGGTSITINVSAQNSMIDERWFATQFKPGIIQVLRDAGVQFRG